ncbi:hypothetical protein SAMN02746062_00492 [Alysiella filiformis DSM 16848]|uniref:Uncharacterized protein n=2 Tax=Alysiella TaxID=194195 RepID=A0A286E5E0_9NEIS|nr:hypothetical protein SAMN02746062_00492 [Alysiella filiformis DSM 16848]
MYFCQFIKVIANNTAKKIPKEYGHQHIFLATIALMPLYLEIKSLDLWEEACQNAHIEAGYQPLSDEMEKLIYDIFDFARVNLYCAYDKNNAETEWLELKNQLIKQNIIFPDYYDFSHW